MSDKVDEAIAAYEEICRCNPGLMLISREQYVLLYLKYALAPELVVTTGSTTDCIPFQLADDRR